MTLPTLKRHPNKDGYFIDGGLGEPISKTAGSLSFEFQEYEDKNKEQK
jgi:hypothetical protein